MSARRRDTEHFLSPSRQKKVKLVRSLLAEKVGVERAAEALLRADEIYAGLVREWAHIPEGEKQHTENFIFPNAALYQAMREHIPAPEAERIIERAAIGSTEPIGRALDKITRIPGAAALFLKVFARMVDASYGEPQGFKSVFHTRSGDELSLDILACPYQKYYTLLGCPELCRYNCLSDEACYGHMKKVEFARSQTLGKGGDLCDFRFRRVKG